MGKFAIHGFWKHPVAAVMAFAVASYFGFIFTALAKGPPTQFPGGGVSNPFENWCPVAIFVPWCNP